MDHSIILTGIVANDVVVVLNAYHASYLSRQSGEHVNTIYRIRNNENKSGGQVHPTNQLLRSVDYQLMVVTKKEADQLLHQRSQLTPPLS